MNMQLLVVVYERYFVPFYSRDTQTFSCEWSDEGIQAQNRLGESSRTGRPRLKRWGKFLSAW